MSSRQQARLAFSLAMALLFVSGFATYWSFSNFSKSQALVNHTREVQSLLGEVESTIAAAARARLSYVFEGSEDAFDQYQNAVQQIPIKINQLRELTKDNPAQRENCDRLEVAVSNRVRLFERSVAIKRSGKSGDSDQPGITKQSVDMASQSAAITQTMRREESHLLDSRSRIARQQFVAALVILGASFVAAVFLFLWHYRLIGVELAERKKAEDAARAAEHAALNSEEAARHLSMRLLGLQDEERRRFSRELHDSLGQYLASLKMNLSQLSRANDGDRRILDDSLKILDDSIAETRTLSHLLHPPLLDELGFASAAEWYVEGFAARSGLSVDVKMPEERRRLAAPVELALFRILQESLTNIHRHSKSSNAEVSLLVDAESAVLIVQDSGKGIAAEQLARFQTDGANAGVGLAGMRERVRQLGGQLLLQSSGAGTTVTATIPIPKDE
jgi:signal transduction histidine kinase